jgi:uncharacterized phage protein gp47/JayE
MANFVPQVDYTSRDYSSIREDLLNLIPLYAPEWTSRDSADFGIILLEMFSYMGDLLNYYIDRAANESFLTTASQRDSVLRIANILGYTPTDSVPATATLTFSNPTDTAIVVPALTQVASTTVVNGANTQIIFETNATVTVPVAVGSVPGQINVLATEGETITDENVGNSDGTADQEFVLSNSSVISNSISVTVNDTVYNAVPYIIDAAGIDPVFYSKTDADEVTSVVFGDNVGGRVPPANSEILVTYRIGGGTQGNVNANTITNILTNYSSGLTVNNATAATGGADLESTDSIRVNAPSSIRAVNRAVSLRDYGDLAVQVTGVAKAIAFSEVYTSINLYIAPAGDPGSDSEGDLTPVFNQLANRLGQFFIDKTPPNVTLTLFPPTFVGVNITASIQALPQYKQSVVKRNAETALAEILAFDNVNFADRISLHYVIQALAAASGVSYSNVSLLAREDDDPQSGTNDAVFLFNEIPQAGTITITVDGGIAD